MVKEDCRVLATIFALCAAAPFIEAWFGDSPSYAQSITSDQRKYVVDGLALGGMVRVDSQVYKQYQCSPSDQFRNFTYCARNKSDDTPQGHISSTTTILHESNGSAAYINKYIAPAFFEGNDANDEIARLSAKYAQNAQIVEAPKLAGAAHGRIAIWGDLRLTPLFTADLAIARVGGSPSKGILVDFVGDYTRSAQLGLPVYMIGGGSGFVWIAHYDDQGRGGLRFFAIDAARLSAAFQGKDIQARANLQQPQAMAEIHPTQVQNTTQEQLDKCGSSCPNDPAADKLRIETQGKLDEQNLVAEEAEAFAGAIGDMNKLSHYLVSCHKCDFQDDAQRELKALRNAQADSNLVDREKAQYYGARGNIQELKKYVAECQVCTFARYAVEDIQGTAAKYEQSLFQFELCNNDYLAVDVAIAGRQDPISNMWTSQGWWQVDSGKCRVIGTYAKGKFYYHAKDRHADWSGNSSFCTSNEAFTILLNGQDCMEGESTEKFVEVDVGDAPKYTVTLNAVPWTWAAVACSQDCSIWGFSGTGHKSLDEAKSSALEWCGRTASDCRIVSWARDDKCLALYTGTISDGQPVFGSSVRDRRMEAHNVARSLCRESIGAICVISVDSCSR
jgi:uncharacterized membrane protein